MSIYIYCLKLYKHQTISFLEKSKKYKKIQFLNQIIRMISKYTFKFLINIILSHLLYVSCIFYL